jgi:hypothetical protein
MHASPAGNTMPMKTEVSVRRRIQFMLLAVCVLFCYTADAEEEAPEHAPSPWVLLPTFSNNPKLGTSVGAMAAYLHKFDAQSQLSVFGTSAQYTSTDSATAAVFARTSFAADHHRITALAVGGESGMTTTTSSGQVLPLKSEDHIRSFAARYLYRVKNDWFVGAQALATNYQIVGQTRTGR